MNFTKKTGFILIVLALVLLAVTTAALARETGNPSRFETNQQEAIDSALNHLRTHKETWNLTEADLADVRVTDVTVSRQTGVTHIYLVQRLQGIELFNGLINISIMPDGQVLHVGNRFISDLSGAVKERGVEVTAEAAIEAAAAHLELAISQPLVELRGTAGADQETLFSDGGISQNDIPAKLVYDASGKEVRLAWNVIIYQPDSQHWWNVRVDANNGAVLSQNDWVVHDHFDIAEAAHQHDDSREAAADRGPAAHAVAFGPTPVADGSSYLVYEIPIESPSHASPPTPADGRTLQHQPADAIGSPFGWHDTNGVAGPEFTTTQGNNVHAYTDTNNSNTPDPGSSPDGGPGLDFVFPLDLTQAPSTYRPAAVTNLFYWNNLMHDIPYRYGFDEQSGNFQQNNYGNGGLGGDYLNAEAQDGGGTNNANFATPPDGGNPRMQMYLWNYSTPNRDGDLDNGIIAHEYGHGISNRLVGGPSNVSCLSNAEQMGEGWSDWQSVILTMRLGDTATTNRGVGTYALNQPTNGVGIRPAPYNTDMAINGYTYDDLPAMTVPHGVGVVWNTMLWEMNWALIEEHGFNPDIYDEWSTGGNNLAYQLVSDGLKLTPCSPGFVDGRNAILAADTALTGGANACTIWTAFAKRGLGFSAIQGSSSNTTDGTAAFDLPGICNTLEITPPSQNICQGDTALYQVNVGVAYTQMVSMSASGHPAPATATFNPNPVTPPGATELTIANSGAVPAGDYTITILGDDGIVSDTMSVELRVYEDIPGSAPTLVSPANGATEQFTAPTFSWNAVPGTATYLLEVADDISFNNVIYTATESGESHTIPDGSPLSYNTWHYWRVTADNPCGSGATSPRFRFRTVAQPDAFCSTPAAAIPDNNPAGVDDVLLILPSGEILDVDVYINANHTWVGDLIFTLTHEGTTAVIFDRPGVPPNFGCSGDNIDNTADDEATLTFENDCTGSTPAYIPGEHYVPGDPPNTSLLAAFDGMDMNGSWTLNVSDHASGDTGTLNEWCVLPTLAASSGGVELSPDMADVGAIGSSVTYTIHITNTGSVNDTFDLTVDAQWPTILSVNSITLNAGEAATFTAMVDVPSEATVDEEGFSLVTATAQGDSSVTNDLFLTTTALPGSAIIYLPVLMKP